MGFVNGEADRGRGYDSTVESKEIEEGERAEALTLLGETWRETLP